MHFVSATFNPCQVVISSSRTNLSLWGGELEFWDDGDVPTNIFRDDPYLKILRSIFIPVFTDFKGEKPVELPKIKFHDTLKAPHNDER